MHRVTALVLCLMLALSVALGSAVHAAEGAACVDAATVNMLDHSDGDADQVQADADKGYPHHHGGCHGHHVGVPAMTKSDLSFGKLHPAPSAWRQHPMAPVASDPALRPPQG